MGLPRIPRVPADPQTRRRILQATADAAAETGLVKFSMENIAKRASLGRATLYLYFTGRDQLFEAVVIEEIERISVEVAQVSDAYADPAERLVHGVAHAYRALRSHAGINAVLALNPNLVIPHLFGDAPTLRRGRGLAEAMVRPGDLPDSISSAEFSEHIVRLLQSLILAPSQSVDLDQPGAIERWARQFLVPLIAQRPAEGA